MCSVLRCQARSILVITVNSATAHFKFLCPQLFLNISRSLFVIVYRPGKDESLRLGCLSLELNLGHSAWSCMHAVSRLAVILMTTKMQIYCGFVPLKLLIIAYLDSAYDGVYKNADFRRRSSYLNEMK